MPDHRRLAILIRHRKAARVTLAQMARACGLEGSRAYESVSAWERGEAAKIAAPLTFPSSRLSRVDFLGEIGDLLHSGARLPLIPPAPFSHTGRRGSLGILMAETGDGIQGLAEKSTPVRGRAGD